MKKYKLIKEYPIIIGIIGIMMIALFLLAAQKQYTNRQIETVASNEDYERENNVTIRTPAEAVLYFWKAVQNDDIDQVMRIFPISYLAQKYNVKYCIEESDLFYANLTYAPTLNYKKYFAIASAEVTGQYAEKYLEIKEDLGTEFKEADLIDTKYIELEDDEELLEVTGASETWCYDAYYELQNKVYKFRLILVKYNKEWLVYDVGKRVISSNADMEEEKEYDSNIEQKIKEYSKIRKKYKKTLEDGTALWNTNYVWSNAVYRDTPELLMDEFMRCLQTENMDKLLTLGNHSSVERNLNIIDEDQLIARGTYAEQLKYFCYSLLLQIDTFSESTLDEIGLNASEIISSLKPQYFFYTELVKMVQKSESVYTIIFKYEGMYFEFEFEFVHCEKGWQIYDIGRVTVYSPDEYNERVSLLE